MYHIFSFSAEKKFLKWVDKLIFFGYNNKRSSFLLDNGYPSRAKMGAIKDGSPTSLNKWERLKMGTLPV